MTEKQKEYARKYYQENKEYFKKRQKEWRTKNKHRWQELCAENRRKRVARLREQGVTNPYSVIQKKAEAKYDDR